MIIGTQPVPVVQNLRNRTVLVVIQNLNLAGGNNVIVSTSLSDCKHGSGIAVGPGAATPQWTLLPNEELYACTDPAQPAGTTSEIAVIEQ